MSKGADGPPQNTTEAADSILKDSWSVSITFVTLVKFQN